MFSAVVFTEYHLICQDIFLDILASWHEDPTGKVLCVGYIPTMKFVNIIIFRWTKNIQKLFFFGVSNGPCLSGCWSKFIFFLILIVPVLSEPSLLRLRQDPVAADVCLFPYQCCVGSDGIKMYIYIVVSEPQICQNFFQLSPVCLRFGSYRRRPIRDFLVLHLSIL